MTPEQILAIANQVGALTTPCYGDVVSFSGSELAEFVRLVRERALDEAAAQCRQLADCEENTEGYRNGAAWCAEKIRNLK